MRSLVCLPLLVLALAGCVAPEETGDPLIGACPHWAARGDPLPSSIDIPAGGNVTQEWVPRDPATGEPRLALGDYMFDRILVQVQDVAFAEEGTRRLQLFAHSDGRALLIYEHGVEETPRSHPFVTFTSDSERTFDVYLAPVDEGTSWEPNPVVLRWEAESDVHLEYEVTLYDRVCGVP